MNTYENVKAMLKACPGTWVVTGAAGFIGSNLVEALLKLNQVVIGLDNFSSGHRHNLAQVRDAVGRTQWSRFRLIENDIRSLDACREACRSAQFVLHHAALGSVPHSVEDPLAAHASNSTGFLNMLLAARDSRVERFVYASSSAVYGDHAAPVKTEQEIGGLLSPYAATKYVNELYAQTFARCYGLESVGLRYFNVFGPRQDPHGAYAAVIPQWVASMLGNEPVCINGDGHTTRDFCYVEDVVQANILAATVTSPDAVNEVYNVAVGGSTTLLELFEMIRSLLETRYPHVRGHCPEYRDFRPGDVRLSQADIGKARRLLSYRPAWSVRDGLAHAIDWYAANLPPRQAKAGPAAGLRSMVRH